MDRTKKYSFVLSTMPRLHARSRLLELGVFSILAAVCSKYVMLCYVMLCYVMLSVMLCYLILSYII